MKALYRNGISLVLLAVLVAAAAWCAAAGWQARHEVDYRSSLRQHHEFASVHIVEGGIARSDGAYAHAWGELPTGKRVFIDLTESNVTLLHTGGTVTVALPPPMTQRDTALPVDVLDVSDAQVYRDALTVPVISLVLALFLTLGGFAALRRLRPREEH